ncbi:MAG: three-Cys-motif partner protein TcmP [Verrucomicrobiia bacterium]
MKPTNDPYADREQSQIKHIILKSYLADFAHKILSWADGLTYVDAFAGPWQTTDNESFEDSSFGIALSKLRSAQNTWRSKGKEPSVECVFLEKDPDNYQQLLAFCQKQQDIHVEAINQPFEEAIPQIVQSIGSKKKGRWFPFILVDPKGWKGFSLSHLAPLIQIQPCEVLVNFMTGHIQRFIEDDRLSIQEGFRQLYDSEEYAYRLANLSGQEREDEMVFSYAERLGEVGGYPFVSTALVQNPTKDRTHYHLVYATRHIKGIEVFKTAERKALKQAPILRARAKDRRNVARTGQPSLFQPEELPDNAHLERLRSHFERKASATLETMLNQSGELAYDTLYAQAMRFPIVQEPFLRKWLSENASALGDQKKSPKLGCGSRYRRM